MHLVDLYEWDLGLRRTAPGLRMLHKLKEEHFHLTPQHRMSVKYAAQVISTTVAKGLEQQNVPETEETRKFIELFDQAFDCLNVTNRKDQKPFRKEYDSVNDQRFKFLESVLEYLQSWEDQVNNIPGLTREERSRCLLSHQTVLGWRITIRSIIDLAKKLIVEAGPGKFFFSEKISQDPLEQHFSRHRRIAGCNENPTLAQFGRQKVALHCMNAKLISDLRGNSSGRQVDRVALKVEDMSLPRKKSKSHDSKV